MKSILQAEKECWVCKTTHDLHEHHVFEGTGNRPVSERWGLTVYLCGKHHNLSNDGVHFDKDLDLRIKKFAQSEFEKQYSHELFMREIGRNYLAIEPREDDWFEEWD